MLAIQAHPEFDRDFSLKLLQARKSSIQPKTYLETVNKLETLENDGEMMAPDIFKLLEQKF